jgi:aminocarboxymuconate-semialdehyde decarboxylase
MLNKEWLDLVRAHGGPQYEVRRTLDGVDGIYLSGAPFMTLMPGHFDYALRIADMDAAGVDLAIVSLTCPNVYFGPAEISLRAATIVNDDMARAQVEYPDRIRWMASLPWEYPEAAVAELERAHDRGAVGVMVLANIAGRSLTDSLFAPVWKAIDQLGLPVLVHPTAPPGTAELDMQVYNLIASIGFMFDTTLAVSRMIFSGFFDTYSHLKIIASHAGGTLPYLAGRLDQCYEKMAACRVRIDQRPSEYLHRIYYDSVTYRSEALELRIEVGGLDHVMYGSDYPHNIGDMKGCLARVDALGERRAAAIRSRNAERIFRL